MKHGSVKAKVFSWTILKKRLSDAKSFIWNLFGNLVNKADGTVKDSKACTVITAYKVAK